MKKRLGWPIKTNLEYQGLMLCHLKRELKGTLVQLSRLVDHNAHMF